MGSSPLETKTIDSLGYLKLHQNLSSATNSIHKITQELQKSGYIENQVLKSQKINDSSYQVHLKLGRKIKQLQIFVEKDILTDNLFLNKRKDSIILPITDLDVFVQNTLHQLEDEGYPLSKIHFVPTHIKGKTLHTQLKINTNVQKNVDDLLLTSLDGSHNKFPSSHLFQIKKKYLHKKITKKRIRKIHNEFKELRFINTLKYPEILFLKDTTKLYVYIEKNNANRFDGFIGFNNNADNKLKINGYLNLNLENTIHSGESFMLLWKNDGNKQTAFKTSLEIPYIFKSRFAIRSELGIFKQDSIFQNTKIELNLGYLLNYNTKLYLGYATTTSSDIQNQNSATITDYKNIFYKLNFEYTKKDSNNALFETETSFLVRCGIGQRNNPLENNTLNQSKQYFIESESSYNLHLSSNTYFNLRNKSYILHSKHYLDAELYRFGGINSIRGFEEGILQANQYFLFLTEYNYIANNKLKLHTILDYSLLKNNHLPKKQTTLLALGAGITIKNKDSFLKISLANGSEKIQSVRFKNSLLHFSYLVKF
ncbi:hypothetical protein [Flavobacterium crassostreae]|nr:hypothetical protein [Flavobacterium crassostreae]